jgi:hypothetical protein
MNLPDRNNLNDCFAVDTCAMVPYAETTFFDRSPISKSKRIAAGAHMATQVRATVK